MMFPKELSQKKITGIVHFACERLKEINPEIKIPVSSVLFQGYDTPKNISVIEIHNASKHFYPSQGWDSIDHGNIAFRHLDKTGMHITSEVNRLFVNNISDHIQSPTP